MRTFAHKLYTKRAKAILFRDDAQNSDTATASPAAASKVLVNLILANLFCAALLYVVYLVFN